MFRMDEELARASPDGSPDGSPDEPTGTGSPKRQSVTIGESEEIDADDADEDIVE